MTPFLQTENMSPESYYNTLHRKARVIIENTFGILKNRWRCLCKDRTLHYAPEKCAKIIIACAILHNIAIKFNMPEPDGNPCTDEIEPPRAMNHVTIEDDELMRGRLLRYQLVQRLYANRNYL